MPFDRRYLPHEGRFRLRMRPFIINFAFMKRIPSHLIIFGILALLAAACASIGSPSGGPRDEDPPRFVRAHPAPYASEVPRKTDRISIEFNELVNVKDPTMKVVVSPPSKSIPRVASSGRRVNVTFSDSLLPNTTYTIDFSDAIEDNNEANPLENFSYTFSTGPVVDSLRIAGRVLSALGMEPMQRKLVGVHRVSEEADSLLVPDTSDIPDSLLDMTSLPAIFHRMFDRVARTDDRGRFSIEGLAPGRYRVFALDDTNSDYLFSSPEEEMAFSDVIISPYAEEAMANDTIFEPKLGTVDSIVSRRRTIFLPNDVILRSFLTSRKQQFISSNARQDSTRINLIFNAPNIPIPKFSLVGMEHYDSTDWYAMERSAMGDSLTMWIKDPALVATDTLRLGVTYQVLDSLSRYTLRTDTLRLTTDRPRKPKAKAETKRGKEKAEADSLPPPTPLLKLSLLNSTLDPDRELVLEAETPLLRVDSAAFRLEEKRDTLWVPLGPATLKPDSLNPRRFTIKRPWKYDTTYRLTGDSISMEGIYGLHTGPLSQEFRVKAEKEYCSLTLNIADWPRGLPAFVELLNQSDNPVRREKVADGHVRFNYLSPGKYYFRIIADINGNGVWDTGDILDLREPEPSFYYPKAINIKQNWNKEETWRVFDTPADEMKPQAILKNKPTLRKNQRQNNTGQTDEEEDEEDLFPSQRFQNTQGNQRYR